MKPKNIFYAFVLIILMQSVNSQAWDTTAAKFYPLNVGNVYVYDYISLWFNCDPFKLNGKLKVVIDDYVLKQNGKRYYKFSGWWGVGGGASSWKYQRIDSNSMNVYSYDSVNNSEYLLDSLLVNSGNSFQSSRFNIQSPNAICHSTFLHLIFGTQRIIKGISSGYTIFQFGYSLGEGIGFLGYSACELGTGPLYSLKGCTINGVVYGDTTLTGVQQVNSSIPEKFTLFQNYPNPFNPKTIINYSLTIFQYTTLKIFDALGNEVATLVNEKQNAGSYAVDFNGENYPSGIYFYKLEAGDFSEVKKMILIK